MKKVLRKFFQRPKRKIAGDLIFWALLILLLIPSTRSVFLGAFAKVRTAVFAPALKASDGPMLTEADYQWQLTDLDNNDVQLGDVKGEVLFVNMWATWCPPCRAEMPSIEKLYNKRSDITYLIVSNELPTEVQKFIDSKGFTFPAYRARSQAPTAFQSKGIPTTFIVNKSGRVVYQRTGAFDWNSKKIHDFLDELVLE